MRLGNIFFHNFWLKFFSLIIAFATWLYVVDLVENDDFSEKKSAVEQVFSRLQFSVKEVPIKPAFTGKAPEGYVILYDDIKITPSSISIFGPTKVLDEVDFLTTQPLDVSEYTRSVNLQTGIRSKFKYLRFENKVVDILLPVQKIETGK
jgi:YbbR domain-containing protein